MQNHIFINLIIEEQIFQIANLFLEYKTVILSFLPYAAQRFG